MVSKNSNKTGVQQALDALDVLEEESNTSEYTTEHNIAAPTSSKKSSGKKALGWILLSFLLSAALAGLGWLFMQQKSAVDSLQTEVAASQTAMTALQSDVREQAEAQVTAAAEKPDWAQQADAMQAQLDALIQADEQTVASLTAMSEANKAAQGEQTDARTEWAHEEMNYLVRLANHRLALAQDADGAKMALTLADERAKTLGEPTLFPLRNLFAAEIQALSAVPKVDVVGLAARLQSAIKNVDNLQVLLAMDKRDTAKESGEAAESPASDAVGDKKWEQALGSVWDEMRSLVVVRHQAEGEKAVLVPEQRYFLYQNLRLKLDTARLALLRGEQVIYADSLASASQWTQDYFTGAARDAMISTLAELETQTITADLPDISGSLQWLNQQRGNQ